VPQGDVKSKLLLRPLGLKCRIGQTAVFLVLAPRLPSFTVRETSWEMAARWSRRTQLALRASWKRWSCLPLKAAPFKWA